MPTTRLPFVMSIIASLSAAATLHVDAVAAPITGPFELLAAGNISQTITRFEPVFGFSRGQFGPDLGGGPLDIVLDPDQASV